MAPLTGFRFRQVGTGPVEARAGALLAMLGAHVVADDDPGGPVHGTLDGTGGETATPGEVTVVTAGRATGLAGWAASGAMALTGRADGPPLAPPGDPAAGLHAAAAVVELLSALGGARVALDGPALLGERAALTGMTRAGATTVGGAGRLLRAVDGWAAVSLPRPSDVDLLPAWLGLAAPDAGVAPWSAVADTIGDRPVDEVVAGGRELGLAVARVPEPGSRGRDEQLATRGQGPTPAPFLLDGAVPAPAGAGSVAAPTVRPRPLAGRTVLDLSALWAGPLATSILAAAGAEVVKVESATRPDGARRGDPRFFALLDAGKAHVTLDLDTPDGRAALRRSCADADLVVEASRPRALDQLGVERRSPWCSFTAYGRTGPWAQAVGFGDDAAAAGGLVAWDADGPVFVADAVADPASGLVGAAAALAVLVGAPADVDVALREVAAHLVGDDEPGATADPRATAAAPPRARPAPAGVASR